MKTGIELISDERKRQIEVEGWTAEHDSSHENQELALAASCYEEGDRPLKIVPYLKDNSLLTDTVPIEWPWDSQYWKPTPHDRVRELTKAGALYLAQYHLTKEPIMMAAVIRCSKKIDDEQKKLG
jgi:hypothetical protein